MFLQHSLLCQRQLHSLTAPLPGFTPGDFVFPSEPAIGIHTHKTGSDAGSFALLIRLSAGYYWHALNKTHANCRHTHRLSLFY